MAFGFTGHRIAITEQKSAAAAHAWAQAQFFAQALTRNLAGGR